MATANTDRMERFAYDILVYAMSKFDTKTDLPLSKWSENTYKQQNFIDTVCLGVFYDQLNERDIWMFMFKARFNSNGLKKFTQVSECLEEAWKKVDRLKLELILGKAVVSLALLSEFIQFLYSKNSRLFFNKVVSLWKNHYISVQEKFEEGLSQLYFYNPIAFENETRFIHLFIRNYCLSYGQNEVTASFRQMVKDVEYISAVNALCDETDLGVIAARLGKNFPITSSSFKRLDQETEVTIPVETTGLGIRPHEDLLQDIYSRSIDNKVSDKKSFSSSIEGASVTPGIRGDTLSPEEQSKGPGSLVSSSGGSREQSRRSSLPRTPEGISRLEQKRQKHRQLKRS